MTETPREPPGDALRLLVEKWRAKGNAMCPQIPRQHLPYHGWTTQQTYERMAGGILLSCADELEALSPEAVPSAPAGLNNRQSTPAVIVKYDAFWGFTER